MFAKEGKRTFTNCKYSHHPTNVKAYLDLEKHKDVLSGAVNKLWEKGKSSSSSDSHSQAKTRAKGTSQEVKPKYESILRGAGSVTGKTF